MRNKTQKLAKGRKTQTLTKIAGLLNREVHGPNAFFRDVVLTDDGTLYITVQSSTAKGETTYRVIITEIR